MSEHNAELPVDVDESDDVEFDTEEKVVKTTEGFKLKIKSKRGTGTNDRDEVQAVYQSGDAPTEDDRAFLLNHVAETMHELRANVDVDPLEDDDDE